MTEAVITRKRQKVKKVAKPLCVDGLGCCNTSQEHLIQYRHIKGEREILRESANLPVKLGKRSVAPRLNASTEESIQLPELLQALQKPFPEAVRLTFQGRFFALGSTLKGKHASATKEQLERLGAHVVSLEDSNLQVAIGVAPEDCEVKPLHPTVRDIAEKAFCSTLMKLISDLGLPMPQEKEQIKEDDVQPPKKKSRTSSATKETAVIEVAVKAPKKKAPATPKPLPKPPSKPRRQSEAPKALTQKKPIKRKSVN